MRKALDALYDTAAWLAALAMVGLLLLVLASIASRQLHIHLAGLDAYAGYSMAAAGFLALSHTLKRNEHIRVTLLSSRLRGASQRALERFALAVAVLLSGLFAWFAVRLVLDSHAMNDISTGSDATPLWIPQIAFAAGAVVFCIAFVDELVMDVLGRRTGAPAEALRHE